GHGQGLATAAAHPGFVIAWFHHRYPADHSRVLRPAVLGTEQVVGARLGGVEPEGCITAREHVLLDAEGGHEKAVDHVLRGHDHFDVAADGHMEFVDFALASLVLEFPHPLLRDGVDLGSILRRGAFMEEDHRAPDVKHHHHAEGDDRPGDFQLVGTFDLFGALSLTFAEPDGENREHAEDHRDHDARDHQQKDVEGIHVARVRGGAVRPKWKVSKHDYLTAP